MLKRFLSICLCCFALAACNNTTSQSTSEQSQREYTKFQRDSLKQCTDNKVLAIAAVKGAFDRVPENNGFWKRDKVTVNYNDSLKCWVGDVQYHVDRNGTYYKASKTFYVKYWCEGTTSKDMQIFYTVSDTAPVVE